MRALLLFSVILFVSVLANAQTVQGIVTDNSKQPVANATVGLLRAKDSVLLRSTITGTNGSFSIVYADTAALLISVSSVGYNTVQLPCMVNTGNYIELTAAGTQLKAVEVLAKRPMIEVRPDKIVFNVENSVNAAGNTAFDLLRKSPGVLIDNNDNIALLGNGVAVYIDGKPSPLTGKELAAYLRSLQSTDVEAIELIKNPSARYDAAGTGGIINIRLKKNKSYGLNGNLSTSFGVGIFSKYNNNLSLNYRNKKVNVFANYSYYNGRNESWMKLYREQNDSIYDQRSTTISKYTGQNLKLGADYFINKHNTIGIIASFFGDNWNDGSDAVTPIFSITGKNPGRILIADNTASGNKQNKNINLNHHYTDSTGRDWNMDVDYGHFNTVQRSLQPNRYYSPDGQTVLEERDYSINTARTIDLLTVKADYEQPVAGGKLSGGVKTSFVKTANSFLFSNFNNGSFQQDSTRSNSFALTENIYAGYISYQRKVKKWDWQLGVRMEHTHTNGVLAAALLQPDNQVVRDYTDFFPSLAVSYLIDKNSSLNFNYSRRINRPGYQSLNPFESKLDELTYQKGNPFLKPEYTNSVSITHTYKYKLNTSIGYSRTTDFSAQITDTIEGKRNFIQQRNAGVQENVYINISYPFNIVKWWSVYLNTGANRLANKVNLGPGLVSNLAVISYSFYSQHTLRLPQKFTVEISGFYNSPSVWGGTFLNKSFWGVDAGVQKKLLRDKLLLKMTVSDIFNSMHWQGISNFGGLYMDASGGWESRQLKVNAVYRFGRKEIRNQRNRSTGSEDINQRL